MTAQTRDKLLLGAVHRDGLVGITRLMQAANLTHERAHALLATFEEVGWVVADRAQGRRPRALKDRRRHVLEDLRRVDEVMQDHELGLPAHPWGCCGEMSLPGLGLHCAAG